MYDNYQIHLQKQLTEIESAGLYKQERILVSPQGPQIRTNTGQEVLNFCANNYLGFSNDPRLIIAATQAMKTHGYGMSSVRFICGTTDLHKELETSISNFFGTEDTILYAAAFDANGGVFEPLLTDEDAIISDTLNHASIIDGVRLCKAQRFRYANADMNDLEEQLRQAQSCRFRLIVTDGVFSMDGNIAPLDKIKKLAEQYNAMIMVDESHSAGVIGKTGRGTTEHFNLIGQAEIITGTLGKAFGGAIGGFTTGKKEIIAMLRQRSRPYLFSNSIPPTVAAAGIEAFRIMNESTELLDKLHENRQYFVEQMTRIGYSIKPTQSGICAVMLGDAKLSQEVASRLLTEGIYVIGFYFPVVPQGQARIRVQLSAAHTHDQLVKAVDAFEKVGRDLKILP
ncbi:MAG: glycine C-acetyltransferase [Bacteroidales bacterium]|jgi:glycine C-acetyltransferase|nr:glycine C-acetyltransferase [Bacteroidales bacterium]MCK9558533.1 glycine C-acetyltransferase [Candidatus Cloacimonadota bacterium]MDD2570672.1 glycine C-acetyltransferase [Bacteroidales bacterium]MDD3385668.1 glycine C-acetyltransferase [Bacteroidales bacterium]MDD3812226.1 glycine C-acetyltransferase [Bacteroidales bacterium]